MRDRQRDAVNNWIKRNGPANISLQNGGKITLTWKHRDGREKSIVGNTADTVDSLLIELTQKEWQEMEKEDRKLEPAYDKT